MIEVTIKIKDENAKKLWVTVDDGFHDFMRGAELKLKKNGTYILESDEDRGFTVSERSEYAKV